MQFSMTRLILYVYDVDLLRSFYRKHFELGVTAKLNDEGVPIRELKRFDGFPWLMCDGCDPEGNVFQLCQPD